MKFTDQQAMLPTGVHCIGNASIEANLTLKLTPELVQELIFFLGGTVSIDGRFMDDSCDPYCTLFYRMETGKLKVSGHYVLTPEQYCDQYSYFIAANEKFRGSQTFLVGDKVALIDNLIVP
jgi:hypothetical protein